MYQSWHLILRVAGILLAFLCHSGSAFPQGQVSPALVASMERTAAPASAVSNSALPAVIVNVGARSPADVEP